MKRLQDGALPLNLLRLLRLPGAPAAQRYTYLQLIAIPFQIRLCAGYLNQRVD
jgi:hypothetical protein